MSEKQTKRAKACDIPERVKRIVWERDGGTCVLCGSRQSCLPSAHFISRAHGGKGIPENIVTLCTAFGNGCHYLYDNGTKMQRAAIKEQLKAYLKEQYPSWDEEHLTYKKMRMEEMD